jgi:hypothetical protein
MTMNDFHANSSSNDDILKQLFNQASSVRRKFEESPYYASSKRKHTVSAGTAAAAQHMASLNRKRKFANRIWTASTASSYIEIDEEALLSQRSSKQARYTFQSPISRYTRLGKDPIQPQVVPSQTHPVVEAQQLLQATDIILRAYPDDFTLTYNDVVCGSSGATTSSLVGNKRFRVWIDAHKSSFARSSSLHQDSQIARSVVNAVASSVPAGRFLSMDMRTGLWFDVGYERSVEFALEALASESKEGEMLAKMMTNKLGGGVGGILKQSSAGVGPSVAPRVLASKAA